MPDGRRPVDLDKGCDRRADGEDDELDDADELTAAVDELVAGTDRPAGGELREADVAPRRVVQAHADDLELHGVSVTAREARVETAARDGSRTSRSRRVSFSARAATLRIELFDMI